MTEYNSDMELEVVDSIKRGRYHCDNCLVDITNGPRFKCLTCEFFDLCENCVILPLEIKQHTSHHMMDRVDLLIRTKKESGVKRKRS